MSRSITTPRRSDPRGPAARRQRRLGVRLPRARGWRGPNWRLASAAIVLILLVMGIIIFASPAFYVTRAEIGGVRYISPEEIYTLSGIASYHILWVQPEVVAERLVDSPSISAAEVLVGWPARVVIVVREREPALVWEQEGIPYWVDVNGHLMLQRADLPDLVRVVNQGTSIPFRCPGPACSEEGTLSVEPAVVQGAQQLKTLRPDINVLYYDPVRGLSLDDPRGWRGWFGIGTDMARKLQVYEALITSLTGQGIFPAAIDVSNPEAPVYRIAQ